MGGELRKISQEELERVLKEHELWIESDGKDGRRADLSGADLSGADPSGADLIGADLDGTEFSGAFFTKPKPRTGNNWLLQKA